MVQILVNSDAVWADKVKQALKENDGYCPCKIIKDKNTKCMCKDFRDLKEGQCECGLYIKVVSNVN